MPASTRRSVSHRRISRPAIVVMNQPGQIADALALPGPDRVFDRVEYQL